MAKASTSRKLDDDAVAKMALAKDPYVVHDTLLARFSIRVSRQHKTWMIQAERSAKFGKRRTYQIRLGRHPMVSAADARADAVARLALIDVGKSPTQATPSDDITLAAAWQDYKRSLERKVAAGLRSARTVEAYGFWFALLKLGDETLRNLSDDPGITTREYERIAREHGLSSASAVMRLVRAAYRRACKNDRSLSPALHPCTGIDFEEGESRSPGDGMSVADLPGWYAELQAVQNPVIREFHWFCLLTGLRRGDVLSATWDNIDFNRRTIFLPCPKGGKARAFHLPLSKPALRCLERAREAGLQMYPAHAATLCFPGRVGQLSSKGGLKRCGHTLRRTFAGLAEVAGVPQETISRLMNHRTGGQTGSYINNAAQLAFYSQQMESIGALIVGACGPDGAERGGQSPRCDLSIAATMILN